MCWQREPLQSAFSCYACVQVDVGVLIWWSEHACLVYCRCCIIPHYTQTHSPAASLPFPSLPAIEYPSTPSSSPPSLPPSLAGLYLPAALRGNYQSLVSLSGSTAMLRFLYPYSTRTWTHRCRVDMAQHSIYIMSLSWHSFVKSIHMWSCTHVFSAEWRCVSLCRQSSCTEDNSLFILNES